MNTFNIAPSFLPSSRKYPDELPELIIEISKSYIDVAKAINEREISIYPTTKSAQTGNNYFIQDNKKQYSFRQIYRVTSTANIPHGLEYSKIKYFSKMIGTYTDGTNWFGLIPASSIAIIGQVSFYITSSDIVFVSGAAAFTPTNGLIILEWI